MSRFSIRINVYERKESLVFLMAVLHCSKMMFNNNRRVVRFWIVKTIGGNADHHHIPFHQLKYFAGQDNFLFEFWFCHLGLLQSAV
jgi:hypothetical protein